MSRIQSGSRWVVVALFVMSLVAVGGCDKRVAGLAPTPGRPEGVQSPLVRLLGFHALTLPVAVLDTIIHPPLLVTQKYPARFPEGSPVVEIVDGTPANSFELFQRDDAGNYARVSDFPIATSRKYIDAGLEVFNQAAPPTRDPAPTFIARGLVDGVATHFSPITNEMTIGSANLVEITYGGERAPQDSLFVIAWTGVPNAAGYWIHVYERPVPASVQLQAAVPEPFAPAAVNTVFLAFLAGNQPGVRMTYKLGSPATQVLTRKTPRYGSRYFVRVAATDDRGQEIGITLGDVEQTVITPTLQFLLPFPEQIEHADKILLFYPPFAASVDPVRPVGHGPNSVSDGALVDPPAIAQAKQQVRQNALGRMRGMH